MFYASARGYPSAREVLLTRMNQLTGRLTERTRFSESGTATAPVSADSAAGSRGLTMRLHPIQLLAHLGGCGPSGPKHVTGWTRFVDREHSLRPRSSAVSSGA